jgi:hypothetical protein
MFKHMYQRRITNDDLWQHHFFFDGNYTSLLDFSRASFFLEGGIKQSTRPLGPSEMERHWSSFFKMMNVASNTCHQSPRKIDFSRVDKDTSALNSEWAAAMQRCEFQQPLPSLAGKNSTHLAEMYDMLTEWTGGCPWY